MIYELNIPDFRCMNKKGKNRIRVTFDSYIGIASFFYDSFVKIPKYNVFITMYRLTCKGLIRQVDFNFSASDIKVVESYKRSKEDK